MVGTKQVCLKQLICMYMPASITKEYPTLSSIILNAGIQRTLDFTNPSYEDLSSKITSEVDTNYTAPLLTITAFLPHLISLGSGGGGAGAGASPSPTPAASVILVTSGLALVPMARCANYCSTKSALHHFGLSLRSQMQSSPNTQHVRVIVSSLGPPPPFPCLCTYTYIPLLLWAVAHRS